MRSFILVSFAICAACSSPADESQHAAHSEISVGGESPVDIVTYEYELTLPPHPAAAVSDCTLSPMFLTTKNDSLRGTTPDDFPMTATVLKGEFQRPRHDPVNGVLVQTYCRPGSSVLGEDKFEGKSRIDMKGVSTSPGPMVLAPLTEVDGWWPAGTSFGVRAKSVERTPVIDTTCQALSATPTNRFYIQALTRAGGGENDWERKVTFDGRLVADWTHIQNVEEEGWRTTQHWFSYCRPTSEGHPDDVNIDIEVVERDVFFDDRYHGQAVTVAVDDEYGQHMAYGLGGTVITSLHVLR